MSYSNIIHLTKIDIQDLLLTYTAKQQHNQFLKDGKKKTK